MLRFDQLIRAGMIVRDVKQKYPRTIPVFERLGFRAACDDCAIEIVARRQDLSPQEVVDELNEAAFGE